ncbi:MAG TPA: phosphoribosyltransferase family protein [Acidimicrobiia bacterium]
MRSGCHGVVLGLPRGGVPVAAEISHRLGWPLDILVVRKIGFPGHEQLAMGAVASGGITIKNQSVIADGRVSEATFMDRAAAAAGEVVALENMLRDVASIPLSDESVILVDDGLATGSTMKAAIEAVQTKEPESVIVAIPVAPEDTLHEIAALADDVVCLLVPSPFVAVGIWYRRFPQVPTAEVRRILHESRQV